MSDRSKCVLINCGRASSKHTEVMSNLPAVQLAGICDKRHVMLDGLEGRKSLELIIAIYQAATTRREVRLRYVPEGVPLGIDFSRSAT